MIDKNKTLKTVAKLRRIEWHSELERAVINNLIALHLIAIYEQERKENLIKIKSYTTEEYYEVLENLENKMKKM